MANPVASQMLDDKKKRSKFASLSDGDTIQGEIIAMSMVTKQGFSGDEIEVLRTILRCDIEGVGIMDKQFDNGSNKWLAELIRTGADVGDVVEITREGELVKTKYHIKIITKKGGVEPQATTAEAVSAQGLAPEPVTDPDAPPAPEAPPFLS